MRPLRVVALGRVVALRRVVALGCLAAALTAAAGCGLPVDPSPQAIPPGEIPLALRIVSPTTPGSLRFHNAVPVPIYLLGPDNQLVSVKRYLLIPPTPQEILDALEAGPFQSELDVGVQSAIPPGAHLLAAEPTGGVLTVLLDSTFGSLRPGQATYEFAQIVYSVTSLSDVRAVVFSYNGGDIQPEVGTGAIATKVAVDRSDYRQLVA